jgi:glycosyltransferase involved in cell wall biosynthesis
MSSISACIVAFNGEKEIKKCLSSIKNVVDEIIVVHDGKCSDNTLNICKKYTDKIFIQPYVGEAEPHRNFSFKQATSEWILWIDQDEQLSKDLQRDLRQIIRSDAHTGYEEINAFTFLWSVKYGNKWLSHGYFSRVPKLCLFRKKAMLKYNGLPNECLKVKGRTIDTEYRMLHKPQGERNTIKVFFNRTRRIVKIHAEQLVKKDLVKMPSLWYLLKAPLWFMLYLGYYFVIKQTFKSRADISITLQNALYNLYLYYYVFEILLNKEEKAYGKYLSEVPHYWRVT